MKRNILLIAMLLLFLFSCTAENEGIYEHLDALSFQNAMELEGAFLLDVRTPGEYTDTHIPGAELIPLQELEARIEEIADYKDKPLLVYCRSGNRSRTAAQILRNQGFTEIYNLNRGIGEWISTGLPVE